MTSNEIRQSFLDFFKNKQHHIVPSAPVVPQDDPTLLFTNAGMNQFKDIFLGTKKRDHARIADSQKCIRVSGKHNDLEEVGRDTYHHTLFEMLGNWSFGDYFKEEAISWAWELLTDVWKLPKDRLFATVFGGDEKDGVEADVEAEKKWQELTDIAPDHILRFDKKDNFWEMGDTGPCGPCSEIHIDRGEGYCDSTDPNHVCEVNAGCARYIELWNLVFIQYNRDESGKLHTLPAKHVDTGAGFERICAVMQDKASNYDTDIFTPIIEAIEKLTGTPYAQDDKGTPHRVLADHIRALSFAIADGAIPGNEGRGYVLRRILRRGSRFGRVLGMHEPFMYKLVDILAKTMGHAFPELVERQEYIEKVIKAEEESFGRTLDRGIELFESKAADVLKSTEKIFSGKDAFLLHDTFGFPLDLTQLMAEEKGLTVNVKEFNTEMEAQRVRSTAEKSATYQTIDIGEVEKSSEFVGYNHDVVDTIVVHAEKDKIVLEKTCFYAESGGQLGDTGVINNESFEFKVKDTKKIGAHIVHFGELAHGSIPEKDDSVIAYVNKTNRRATERNHTVTHLVHKALKTVLGDHVNQAGSLVGPEYMRFDFTHFEKLSDEQITEIENIVNNKILENLETTWTELAFDEAKAKGATALFGEKYGDVVRMVEIEDYSKELCGGTHVHATGEIGSLVITSESAVAAGIRRIECLTGLKARDYLKSREATLKQAAQLLNCSTDETISRLENLLKEQKEINQELKALRQAGAKDDVNSILDKVFEVNGIKIVAEQVTVSSVDDLRDVADMLRNGLGSGVGVLASVVNEKLNFICIVTKDLIDGKGLKAGDIVKKVAQIAKGGGGGAPHMAMAGAKDVSKISEALAQVKEIVNQATS